MNNANSKSTGEISLKTLIFQLLQFLAYLRMKWWLILVAIVIGAALGYFYSNSKKPVYVGELTFALMDDEGGSLGGTLALANQLGFNFGSSTEGVFAGENLLELMKSRSMLKKALLTAVTINGQKQTLADYYISFNSLRKGWEEPRLKKLNFTLGTPPNKLTQLQDSLMRAFHKAILKHNLTVDKKDKRMSIITVSVTSGDQYFSKYFAEILVREVSNFYVDTRTKKAARNLALLQYRADSVQRALNLAMSGMAVSADANPNANPAMQVLQVPSRRSQIDVQRNSAILNELERNLELAKISLRKETPLIQIIDTPDLPLEKLSSNKLLWSLSGGIAGAFLVVLFFGLRMFLTQVMMGD